MIVDRLYFKETNWSVDLYHNWNDYEKEFGKLTKESWQGLGKIHQLTPDELNTTLNILYQTSQQFIKITEQLVIIHQICTYNNSTI